MPSTSSSDVKNAEGYAGYSKQVPATIAKYGGRYLVRGGKTEVREGEWRLKAILTPQEAGRTAQPGSKPQAPKPQTPKPQPPMPEEPITEAPMNEGS